MANKSIKGNGQPIPKLEINLELSSGQGDELLKVLRGRFENNMNRHKGLAWFDIQAKLEASPEKLSSLNAMESTGGEPDVVAYDKTNGEFVFCDCSEESPQGRRNICYDGEGQAAREKKGVFPAGNAMESAAAMGIELIDEDQYRKLQLLGEFDTKTSSWILTPVEIRKLGGALFCDRRYNTVFVFHNGAESFYSGRGFRGTLRV